MFIIYGSSSRETVVREGSFYCRRCRGEEDYSLVEARTWLTLFFVPVCPVSGSRRYVFCQGCHGSYKTHVINNRYPEEEDELDEIYDELREGMPLEKVRAQLIAEGVHAADAADLVDEAAGERRRRCQSCALTYVAKVRRCSSCNGDL